MFSRIYKIVERYFNFKADSKARLVELFITSLFNRVSLLPLPFIASRIVDYITKENYKSALIYVLIFALSSFLS